MQRRFLSYPVVDGARPVGIITLHQAREVPRDEWERRRVDDTMTPATEDLLVAPEESMASVLDKLRRSPVRRVLVLKQGELEGIITACDVTAWLERMRAVRE
jgi:CBS domain-containing protein